MKDGAGGHAERRGDGGRRLMEVHDAMDDLGSTARREPGLTVQVHAAVVLRLVLCDNPTFPSPRRMNNLLEYHSWGRSPSLPCVSQPRGFCGTGARKAFSRGAARFIFRATSHLELPL